MKSSLINKLAFVALIILAAGQIPSFVAAEPPAVLPAADVPEAAFGTPAIGEVRLFAGNFAPRGWAFCHGQLLSISSNSALFSILGTTYGGDGRTSFGLPDLRGRAAVGVGVGPGLTEVRLGEKNGAEQRALRTETVIIQQPAAAGGRSGRAAPRTGALGNREQPTTGGSNRTGEVEAPTSPTPPQTITVVAPQSVNTQPPGLGLNYIICLEGIYPSRN